MAGWNVDMLPPPCHTRTGHEKKYTSGGKENFRSKHLANGNGAQSLSDRAELKDHACNSTQVAHSDQALTQGSIKDPVQHWVDYVRWTMKHEPHAQGVVLARACCALARDPQHKADIRFLRLLVRFADTQPLPQQIFQSIEEQGVGTNHALLYEAWAVALEKHHRFSEADEIYRRGINRKASPVERLHERQHQFKKRMQRRRAAHSKGETKERAAAELELPKPQLTRSQPVADPQAGQQNRPPKQAVQQQPKEGHARRRPFNEVSHEVVDPNATKQPSVEAAIPSKRRRCFYWPFGNSATPSDGISSALAQQAPIAIGKKVEASEAPGTGGQEGAAKMQEAVMPPNESWMDGLETIGQMFLEERAADGQSADLPVADKAITDSAKTTRPFWNLSSWLPFPK